MDDHVLPAAPEIPLEKILEDLKLDPVEKAEKEAGISVKMRGKRYQSSVHISSKPPAKIPWDLNS